MAKTELGNDSADLVAARVRSGNPWYVGSHFEWAANPAIRPIYARRRQYFIKCIQRAKGRRGACLRFLDAGCGDGYWLSRLAGVPGLDLVGIDYNPTRIERAQQAVPTARFYSADLLNFRQETAFDMILLNQVIEHVPDDVGLLRRARELLRPGGTFLLGTPNEGSWLQQRQLKRLGAAGTTDHVHFYTEAEVRDKLHQAGFVVECVMREVFYVGSDRIYYALTRRRWGFRWLELMTRLWPAGCSDFYFECRAV